MKQILILLFGIIPFISAKGNGYVPEVFTEERYQHIWSRKPFSPPTPLAPPTEVEGIAQQYILSGLLKIGNEWIAFVQDRKSLKRHNVTKTVNEIGLELVSVKESSEAPTATLRCGQQTGVIRFDPAIAKRIDDSLKTVAQPGHSDLQSMPLPSGVPPASSRLSPIQSIHPHQVDLNQ